MSKMHGAYLLLQWDSYVPNKRHSKLSMMEIASRPLVNMTALKTIPYESQTRLPIIQSIEGYHVLLATAKAE